MRHLPYFLVGIFLVLGTSIFAQSPYQINKSDWPIAIGGGLIFVSGRVLKTNVKPLTATQVSQLDINSISNFDRSATKQWSPKLKKASDNFRDAATLLPFTLLAAAPIRKEAGKVGVLLAESYLITNGLTSIFKGTIKRVRPFAYNENVELAIKLEKNARRSFFSGHTSGAAVYSFFTAKVFSDYFPDSKWKPVIWTGAAIIPALTGYYRYRAGSHFPTDIITGYAVGALVGVLVPHLHRKKAIDNGLTFNVSPTGAYLGFKF